MASRTAIAALSLAITLAATACGGSSGGSKTATPTTAGTTAAATATRAVSTAVARTTPAAAIATVAPLATGTQPAAAPTDPAAATSTPAPPDDPSGAAPTVVAGTVTGAVMQYYDVTGTSAAEIRASMDALGPLDGSGARNDAFTTWNIDWTWPLNPDSSCILSSATISTTIAVTFPRWLPPTGASPPLIERWNTYQGALVTHESGHVSFVVTTAADVLAAIKGATCDTAEAAAQAVVLRIRQHDADYDAETNHGTTQGAHFP